MRLKGIWEVSAGIIPGQPLPEYGRQFFYSSEDYKMDSANAQDGKEMNIFTERLMQAHDYTLSITQPKYVNWVRVDWIWF